jgi:hypothetical protein
MAEDGVQKNQLKKVERLSASEGNADEDDKVVSGLSGNDLLGAFIGDRDRAESSHAGLDLRLKKTDKRNSFMESLERISKAGESADLRKEESIRGVEEKRKITEQQPEALKRADEDFERILINHVKQSKDSIFHQESKLAAANIIQLLDLREKYLFEHAECE